MWTAAPGADVAALGADAPLRTQLELDAMDSLNVITGLDERPHLAIPESDTADSAVSATSSRTSPPGLPFTRHVLPEEPGTVHVVRAL